MCEREGQKEREAARQTERQSDNERELTANMTIQIDAQVHITGLGSRSTRQLQQLCKPSATNISFPHCNNHCRREW